MVAAVVVFAALAVVLAVLLLAQHRRGARRIAACAAESELLGAECAELRSQLEAATAAAESERSEAAARLARVESQRSDTERKLDRAETERTDAARRLAEATAESSAQRLRAEAAEAERARLDHELGEAESRNARLQLRLADADGPVEVAALWDLELTRSERTWRYSVAPLPLGPSPFPDAVDPLRLAVEIEAAALREEVGAPLEVRWEAGPVTDRAQALVVLRLAQELLAEAAREGQTAVLTVEGGEDITLHLRGEDDDPPLSIPVPPVADHLVSVEAPAGDGVRLVVHRDLAVQAD